MGRAVMAWFAWGVTFLCACSTAVPRLQVRRANPEVLVVQPAGHRHVEITQDEFRTGMRMIFSRGPLPGASRAGSPRFVPVSADAEQLRRAAGYLQFCERTTGTRQDCWEALSAAGGLDDSGARDVALRFAFSEALQDAASAVGSMTPEQVRAILALTFVGTIVVLLSPDPFSKYLFIVTATNLIAFVGVDLFNNVVKGYTAMTEELAAAQDFAQVKAAGERYGERMGPTIARIVLMVATYGVAKFAGLFPGGANSLPGGTRAAALAEAQGLRIPAVEGARSMAVAVDGSVTVEFGAVTAMAAVGQGGEGDTEARNPANALRLKKQLASEAGAAELEAGGGTVIAGAGVRRKIDDIARIVAQYGGQPADWVKIASREYEFSDLTSIQVHAYRNVRTGQLVELKSNIDRVSP